MQINYMAYMNHTGYSISAQDYILAMLRYKPDVDIRVHLMNHRFGEGISPNRLQIFTSLHKKQPAHPSLNVYHCIPPRYRRSIGQNKHIGICVFEAMPPPDEWMQMMNNMDLIITASEFNKHIFLTAGVRVPIEVIPHCFDSNMFNNKVKAGGRFGKTTFLSIGTWKKRKNWDTLIRSWYMAFDAKHDVCLLIKTDKPNDLKTLVQQIKKTNEWRSKSTAPIFCEEQPICDFEQIPSIMRKGDIYVTTSLGEGFGLNTMCAMAMGMPVLVPKFGGSLEYAKPDLCTYIEPHRYQKIPSMDGIPQLNNCVWPVLSVEEVAEKMHFVFAHANECNEKARKAYDFVHSKFSYDHIGPRMLEAILR